MNSFGTQLSLMYVPLFQAPPSRLCFTQF